MTDPIPRRRPHLTPAWLIFGLLVVEGLLWLSERYRWPTWHKGYAVLTAVAAVGVVMIVMLGWFIVALVFRWRFQFSIRSLLVLTLAVAVPCSWMAVEMKAAKEQQEAVAAIEKLGGGVRYDWDYHPLSQAIAKRPGQEWLRKLLGTDLFTWDVRGVFFGNEVTDEELARLAGLTQLRWLSLDSNKITDAGLARLAGLTQLEDLRLYDTQITDAGLAHLAGLTELKWLSLEHSPQITDAGVKRLKQALPNCFIIYP